MKIRGRVEGPLEMTISLPIGERSRLSIGGFGEPVQAGLQGARRRIVSRAGNKTTKGPLEAHHIVRRHIAGQSAPVRAIHVIREREQGRDVKLARHSVGLKSDVAQRAFDPLGAGASSLPVNVFPRIVIPGDAREARRQLEIRDPKRGKMILQIPSRGEGVIGLAMHPP